MLVKDPSRIKFQTNFNTRLFRNGFILQIICECKFHTRIKDTPPLGLLKKALEVIVSNWLYLALPIKSA